MASETVVILEGLGELDLSGHAKIENAISSDSNVTGETVVATESHLASEVVSNVEAVTAGETAGEAAVILEGLGELDPPIAKAISEQERNYLAAEAAKTGKK